MAIDLHFPLPFPRHAPFEWGGLYTATALNATVTKIGWRFPCMKAGTYDRIAFRTAAVSSAQSLKVGFQGVTPSTGAMDGTWKGATNNGFGTVATPAANTTYIVNLGETVDWSLNDDIAIVIEWTSTAGSVTIYRGITHSIAPRTIHFLAGGMTDRIASRLYQSAAWGSNINASLTVAPLRSSNADSHHPFLAVPPDSGSYSSFSPGGNPDERGNRIYLPAGRAIGILVGGRTDGDTTLTLYDDSFTSLAAVTLDDSAGLNSSYGGTFGIFGSPVTISEGWYRVSFKPQGSGLSYQRHAYNSGMVGAIPDLISGAGGFTRYSGGAPTDSANEFYDICLLMDQVSEAGGGSRYFTAAV